MSERRNSNVLEEGDDASETNADENIGTSEFANWSSSVSIGI